MSRAKITNFGLLSGTTDTLYATWAWGASNTESYQVKWLYHTGDTNGVWFVGDDSTTETLTSTYSIPSNAKRVKFMVKPISKTYTNNGNTYSYWTAQWSTEKIYYASNLPPDAPSSPTITVNANGSATVSLDNLSDDVSQILFQAVENDRDVVANVYINVSKGHAAYTIALSHGGSYKFRCKARNKYGILSEWSEYSDSITATPSAPSDLKVYARTETSVYISWKPSSGATGYETAYSTTAYGNANNTLDSADDVTTVSCTDAHYYLSGVELGQKYYFWVRAVNGSGNSWWSSRAELILGTTPAAPTTWSSTTTCIVGDNLTLYWTHNSEDGSTQTYAEIELYIDGVKESHTIDSTKEDDDKKTTSYSVNTSAYSEGSKIQWRVRTAGVTKKFSEWSVQRTVDIYAQPVLELIATDSSGKTFESLTQFPFYISGTASGGSQKPIGYYVSVTANESYETTDEIGNEKTVSKGEEIYSKSLDTSEKLSLTMSAGDIDLENNIGYTVKCTVSMDSGLTAEASTEFTVAWTDELYEPNAEISIDTDAVTASIRPYCMDESGNAVSGVTLSVYRREYDGTFTEIASSLSGTSNTFVTDPHPALDLARYRIVAITSSTGAVSYYDVPGCVVGEKAIIIQWDEKWSDFDISNEDAREQPIWTGSMLKLPYNIDVSSSYSPDRSLVEYIGRKHPVSYYGTQLGETASWSVEIDKSDKETLYALRRLSVWQGDAYVREPSGTGYWANVGVSFSQTHCEVTIPVSLTITRVEGGM